MSLYLSRGVLSCSVEFTWIRLGIVYLVEIIYIVKEVISTIDLLQKNQKSKLLKIVNCLNMWKTCW